MPGHSPSTQRAHSDTAAEAPGISGGYGTGNESAPMAGSTEPGAAADGEGGKPRKPPMSKRIVGGAEVIAGHVLGNPAMVMKGQEKKVRVFWRVTVKYRSADECDRLG